MRTVDEIKRDLADLDKQEADLQAEIEAKTKELAEAKASNRNLLQKYLGASKRPASLTVQSERIKNLEIEIGQLREMAPMFGERRGELKKELSVCNAADELGQYEAMAGPWFEKVHETLGILRDAANLGKRLEPMVTELRAENPIQALGRFIASLNDEGDLKAIDADLVDLKAGYYFQTDVVALEKELACIPKAAKSLSDLAFGLEHISMKNIPTLPPAKRVHSIQKDHQGGASGRFDGSSYLGRRLNKNQAAM